MLATGIAPDFIVVDGKEGGTGAAPLEFMDHVGMPLRDGLAFAHNALVGVGLRDRIKLGASGKITTAFDIARAMALGADWCNSARGFMFAVGCIQSQSCHTDKCPTGVATQDPIRQRAIDVPDKAERVASFHRETLKALAELVAAAGLTHPGEFRPHHFFRRAAPDRVRHSPSFTSCSSRTSCSTGRRRRVSRSRGVSRVPRRSNASSRLDRNMAGVGWRTSMPAAARVSKGDRAFGAARMSRPRAANSR